MTYGIPSHILPLNMDNGEIDLRSYHQWLVDLKRREQSSEGTLKKKKDASEEEEHRLPVETKVASTQTENTASTTDETDTTTKSAPTSHETTKEIIVPGPMDMISGRGRRKSANSVGYLRMQTLLDKHSAAYENAGGQLAKVVIADVVLKELQSMGCRFIKSSPEQGYVEESEESAREKISMAFRNRRRARSRSGGTDSFRKGSSKRDHDHGA